MKKNITLALAIVSSVLFSHAQFLPERSNKEHAIAAKNDISIDEMKSFGFSSDDLPSSYSLEKYAVVSNQNDASSCTGFATAGALNILYNSLNNITVFSQKLVHKFDPNFLYSSLKDPNDLDCVSGSGCDCGSFIKDATNLVSKYGIKKIGLSPGLSCSVTLNDNLLSQMSYMTKFYRIDDWINLLSWEEKSDGWYYSYNDDDLKFAISNGLPLVTGIFTSSDFIDNRNTLIPPKGSEGPHAVVIVGYDDYYNGGSFKVLNSYGRDFGDDGYFWIKYDDLINVMTPDGIYLPWNEEGDFSTWTDDISLDNFYRGETTDGKFWEGQLKNNYLHGEGIYVDKDWSMLANFDEGVLEGWCVYFGNDEEDFWGLLKFEDGEVVDSEDWGFAADEEKVFIESVTKNLENKSENLSDDIIEKVESVYKINVN